MYYAVKRGRKKGIWKSWKACEKQVKGCLDALYRKFETLREAEVFAYGQQITFTTTLFPDDEKE
jgi:ribonuclease HI